VGIFFKRQPEQGQVKKVHTIQYSIQIMTNYIAIFALTGCLFVGACGQPKDKATLVLLNGQFFTADTNQITATAVAIKGDRILYVGDDAGAKALADEHTTITDLKGAFAMPGFIEGHGHFASLGRSLLNLSLGNTTNWEEIVQLTGARTANLPAGDWIEGRGWHQEKWTAAPARNTDGYPHHDALSAATPQHPVVLYHASGHALFANARAMALAGISVESADPVGGRIVRDARGQAIGVFEENAMELIEKPFLAWQNKRTEAQKQADFERAIDAATQTCLANGITSFQDAGSDFWEIAQYQRLALAGQLDLRLWLMILQPKQQAYTQLRDFPLLNLGNNYLTVRAVKAYFDGALGSYGALLLSPYADKPDAYGQNTTPLDTLRALAAQCQERGLQFCVHAIGDRANREVLTIMEEALRTGNERWRIEHAQHIDPADQPRFGAKGIIASMQAIHCVSDAPFVVKRLGAERARTGAYAWRSLLDQGARIANGTDTPVEDVAPLACIYASVTRQHPARRDAPAFFPEQCMTREEALYAFEEQDKGSLTPGKLADIVVLSRNLLTCTTAEILEARVLQTIVGGNVRYTP
jgi:predicted amidohydrolase YtcJ